MFYLDGIPILADEYEILTTLRDQVLEQQGRQILRKIKKTGNNIMVCCPIHANGQERKPSCGISTVDGKVTKAGTVHCFACNYVDTLQGMISKCFGYMNDDTFGKNWLLQNFVTGELDNRPHIKVDINRNRNVKPVINYVSEEELASYRYIHPYMYQRKLNDYVIEKYDVGYQKDFVLVTKNEDGTEKKWPPVECLTFPVRDEKGNCLFVSRRAIYNKNFFLPPNIQKPVYGIYELPKDCRTVIVCESVINALTCVVYGFPAVALFGTGDTWQVEQLNKLNVRKLVLGLDPDKAGAKGIYRLQKAIKGKMLSKLIIPKGKDINDLSYEEFINLPEQRI